MLLDVLEVFNDVSNILDILKSSLKAVELFQTKKEKYISSNLSFCGRDFDPSLNLSLQLLQRGKPPQRTGSPTGGEVLNLYKLLV